MSVKKKILGYTCQWVHFLRLFLLTSIFSLSTDALSSLHTGKRRRDGEDGGATGAREDRKPVLAGGVPASPRSHAFSPDPVRLAGDG